MNNRKNENSFPSGNMDLRQAFGTSAGHSPIVGPIGLLADHTETFTSGRQPSPLLRRNNSGNQLFTKNGGYSETQQEIIALLYLQEDEDYIRPTAYAFTLSIDLLENTNAELIGAGKTFPRGTSAASDTGGIYLFWENNQISIQVEIPPKEGGLYYIHTITPGKSLMKKDFSAKTLADILANYNLPGNQRPGSVNGPASIVA